MPLEIQLDHYSDDGEVVDSETVELSDDCAKAIIQLTCRLMSARYRKEDLGPYLTDLRVELEDQDLVEPEEE